MLIFKLLWLSVVLTTLFASGVEWLTSRLPVVILPLQWLLVGSISLAVGFIIATEQCLTHPSKLTPTWRWLCQFTDFAALILLTLLAL